MFKKKTPRLQKWDYGWNATYYVTLRTNSRIPFFGRVENKRMILSPLGEIADKNWLLIPEHFSFVKLEEFIVMPDHIHGLLRFEKPEASWVKPEPVQASEIRNGGKNPKWKSGVLGVVINQYKRICTIEARRLVPDFRWQARYYDRVLRSPVDSVFLGRYILNNPANYKG